MFLRGAFFCAGARGARLLFFAPGVARAAASQWQDEIIENVPASAHAAPRFPRPGRTSTIRRYRPPPDGWVTSCNAEIRRQLEERMAAVVAAARRRWQKFMKFALKRIRQIQPRIQIETKQELIMGKFTCCTYIMIVKNYNAHNLLL